MSPSDWDNLPPPNGSTIPPWLRHDRHEQAVLHDKHARGSQDGTTQPSASAPLSRFDRHVRVVPSVWFTGAPPQRVFLLRDSRLPTAPGVLPLGKVGQVIAAGGVGKTMAMVMLAVAVATGGSWLGSLAVDTPGRVLLVCGEEDEEEVQRRLYRAARAVGATGAKAPPADSIVVLALAGVVAPMVEKGALGNLGDAEFLLWLRAHIETEGYTLVIVDPLSRFAGPDAEKDNAAATRFVQALESLAAPTRTILTAHHTNKVSRGKGAIDGTAGRGSTALFDGARWECSLGVDELKHDDADTQARLGEIVTLAFTKSNYGPKPAPILLRRDLDNGGALVPLDAVDLEAVERARERSGEPSKAKARKAKEQADNLSADTVALARYVLANPGCGVGQARAVVVAGNADRWHRAVHALGGGLRARGNDYADLRPGQSADLTIDRTRLPADVAEAVGGDDA